MKNAIYNNQGNNAFHSDNVPLNIKKKISHYQEKIISSCNMLQILSV